MITSTRPPAPEQSFFAELIETIKKSVLTLRDKVERRSRSPKPPINSPEPQPRTLREQRQALMEGQGIKPEYLSKVMGQASIEPGTEEALKAGDSVWADYLKGQDAGEFRSVPGSPSRAGS